MEKLRYLQESVTSRGITHNFISFINVVVVFFFIQLGKIQLWIALDEFLRSIKLFYHSPFCNLGSLHRTNKPIVTEGKAELKKKRLRILTIQKLDLEARAGFLSCSHRFFSRSRHDCVFNAVDSVLADPLFPFEEIFKLIQRLP